MLQFGRCVVFDVTRSVKDAADFGGDVGKDLADKEFACMVSENSTVEDIVAFVNGMSETRSKSAVEWAKHHLTYDGNKQAVIEMFS